MIFFAIALRHLVVRPGRALVLLLGYALGVAVMIVLLSIGDAMLDQSRDASLVGGGDLTALPHGIDVEAMRTGGLAGMFFGIDGARFVTRELLGGSRHARLVNAVSPEIAQKLIEIHSGDTTWSVRAGGRIPSEARSAGTGLRILNGRWADDSADRDWIAPTRQALYDEIDRFHRPPNTGRDWAEWDYFNVVVSPREWWYVTLLVGGDQRLTQSGGEVLVTHRLPDGEYQRFRSTVTSGVHFDIARADLTLGSSSVTQRNGVYDIRGSAGAATFRFLLVPDAHHYFPPVELGRDSNASGYAVAALTGTATGRFCVRTSCRAIRDLPAYHDHNWGRWHGATWEWGSGRGASHALLYGGVIIAGRPSAVPFFLLLDDSTGIEQIYRFSAVTPIGRHPATGMAGVEAPDSLRIIARRLDDSLQVTIAVDDATASMSAAAGGDRAFLQLRGKWVARGTAVGSAVADSGSGFFETWVPLPPPRLSRFDSSSHPARINVRHP
ncbi:MAG TPA: hypothetical protein VGL65_07850 [Gemmatimonadales bacterium]